MITPNLLFVYGSLKRGEVNYSVMVEAGARFLSRGTTVQPWAVEQGPLWRRLLDRPDGPAGVTGELFVIESDDGWRRLDEFEGHPHGYRRRLEMVVDDQNQVQPAWIYFYVGD